MAWQYQLQLQQSFWLALGGQAPTPSTLGGLYRIRGTRGRATSALPRQVVLDKQVSHPWPTNHHCQCLLLHCQPTSWGGAHGFMMGGVGQLGGGGAHTIELALGYPPTAARQLQIGDVRGPATTGVRGAMSGWSQNEAPGAMSSPTSTPKSN